jgi:hypothetical protein
MNREYFELVKQASSLYKELNSDTAPYVQYQDGLVDMYAIEHCEQILNKLKDIYDKQVQVTLVGGGQ